MRFHVFGAVRACLFAGLCDSTLSLSAGKISFCALSRTQWFVEFECRLFARAREQGRGPLRRD